ncbi:MdtA/MuxA family multidrug efflux RND transporter periplasmic adaptor subunit [Martelella alba]|uniref:MdtA/MuxA family multidrug efflux RND transporter periplasmic adaptor subunit n=1 Tax=Martelella alba TaxID=2590451 RepID=UPI001E2CBA9B|nr:MdtA/MuxA family multidrug efflux RND transporter periplasmic adaptor subunit [Martelella alba]
MIIPLIVLLVIAAVVFRVLHHAPSGAPPGAGGHRSGRFMAGGSMGGATTPVHAGTAGQADVPVYLTALGTVIPNATVTVTSRVDGQLMAVYFTEGQKVAQGQVLAQIDPRSYQATLAQYQGDLAQNQALLKSAQLTLARYRKLYAQDSLAKQDLDSQVATVGQYSGAIKTDEAQIAAARLDIEYSRITSPISGRVGLRLVDPGNNITTSDSTGIVTVTQTQPAAVTFSVPQSNIPVLVKALHHGQSLPAVAFDQDGTTKLAQGEVKFISNEIDTDTGTIKLKAEFANKDESLYPNQFVNIRLQTGLLKQATVIPSQALQLSSDGSFVFVINPDNTVTRKAVKTGPAFGDEQQSILSGISPGDKVVTEGIERLTDGSKVMLVNAQPSVGADKTARADAGRKTTAGSAPAQ